MRNLIISPSPHIHSDLTTRRLMRDVLIALFPAMLVSILSYGFSAVRLLMVGVLSCVILEYLIQKFILKTAVTVNDCSAAVTGVLLALNLPPCTPWWVVFIGSIVAIGIVKMTFGGLGQNIFNPAITARVFLLVSFPVIMTDWTIPQGWISAGTDAFSGATPLSIVKEGLKTGLTPEQIFTAHPSLSCGQMLFARIGGSAGEASALALILGFIYLLVRKVIKPTIPVAVIGTVFVVSGIFYLIDSSSFTGPVFNILTGGVLLGAIFMATDYVTSPMSCSGQIVYGIGIGLLTVLIRFFGAYPEGVSFAILIMNAVVPLLNKYMRPARFGAK
ncbi:MAG: RnfABCDGE type electron transport complex subunit D [Alistipes sp.]|nr:RnfABCDGE type electron transport complex subunit D [Candidatus Minthomonas equi]